jgi:hypothetical protein
MTEMAVLKECAAKGEPVKTITAPPSTEELSKQEYESRNLQMMLAKETRILQHHHRSQ